MIDDPALRAVSRRLFSIEGQLQELRADIDATHAARKVAATSAKPPVPPTQPTQSSTFPTQSTQPTKPAQSTQSSTFPTQSTQPTKPAHSAQSAQSTVNADAAAGPAVPPTAPVQNAAVPPARIEPPISTHPRNAQPTFEALLSGRGLAVVGVLLMLVGCAFFLDLSFTRGWIAPAGRIALGLFAGVVLLAASTRFLRGAYRIAAEASTGLGAGVLYLSSWAALAVFPDLHVPRAAAFAVMAAVATALTLIANRWRSQPIALMGLAGAYLTPLLLGHVYDDRTELASYLFIVTSGLLVLARRRAFLAVEITAALAMLVYGIAFVPNAAAGWTNLAAAAVATSFFVLFAIAFSTRPIGSHRRIPFEVFPFVGLTAAYLLVIENLLAANAHLLGAVLLAIAAILFAAPRIVARIPAELKPAYRCVGLLAVNLALRSLLGRFELFDAFSIEAACLAIYGARIANVDVIRLGFGFFAIAGTGLLYNAATLPPAQLSVDAAKALFTPLTLGFAIWLQSAFAARRTPPVNLRLAFTIAAHVVAFAALTRAVLDVTGGPNWNTALPSTAQMTLSLIWAIFGAGLFARGVAKRIAVERWEGLTLFAITIVKVFTVDLASLDLAYRIPAFLGTGVVLFICSTLYMRSTRPATPPAQ